MASSPVFPLSERSEIHKSCKSLETLLGVLNDYCEVVGTIVTLQKRLGKALRETAGVKTTGEIAANAMNASAAIFEALVEVNSKFAKIADKEYDSLSAEVKKWFKKLAKEEKAHDERMLNANARIKQAGYLYEKKTKKNSQDAVEEHARYLNLIDTLGPEISREKYNHSLLVTQRHISTTYSVAACLCRIADAEWLRTCESVRRFSPTIGQLNEWRPFCEGGWQGSVPEDLRDLDGDKQAQLDRAGAVEKRLADRQPISTSLQYGVNHPSKETTDSAQRRSVPTTPHSGEMDGRQNLLRSQDHLQAGFLNTSSDSLEGRITSRTPSLEPPKQFGNETNTDSVRSLSAFPLPPSHFPLPPPRQQQSSTLMNTPALPGFTESPAPPGQNYGEGKSTQQVPSLPEQKETNQVTLKASVNFPEPSVPRPLPVRSETLPPTLSNRGTDGGTSTSSRASMYPSSEDAGRNHEFGIKNYDSPKSPSTDSTSERTGTDRMSGSLPALRGRYSQSLEATSLPPIDIIPLAPQHPGPSLAPRYDGPSSSRLRSPSPILRSSEPRLREQLHQRTSFEGRVLRGDMPELAQNPTSLLEEEAFSRHQQPTNQPTQLELMERELDLVHRELKLEARPRDLTIHQSREHQQDARDPNAEPRSTVTPQSQPQLRPRARASSQQLQLRQSQDGLRSVLPLSVHDRSRVYAQHSYSTSRLVLPSPSIGSTQAYSSHDFRENSSPTSVASSHGPNCSCANCNTAISKSSQPANLLSPTKLRERSLAEKPKTGGWMKRFSMPVGNAFGLDSKKGIGNTPAGTSIAGGQNKGGTLGLDGNKFSSNMALRSRAIEEGRWRHRDTADGAVK